MNIKKITIIGGGSSGWMAAAALIKNTKNIDITLVESPNIPTVGVGESTLGHINRFLHMLGLKDEDWMAQCNATYKNTIRFTNFRENKGESFHYPFIRGFDLVDKYKGLNTWGELATKYPNEFGPDTFAEVFAPCNTLLAIHNKNTDNANGFLRQYDFVQDTAYHMDAQLFGQYLKNNIAIPNGVNHILNDIDSCVKDDEGNIEKIICKDGQVLTSDLWIDCTGFRSLLLEDWMNSEFVSFGNILMNDHAWACPVPYVDREREMHNYTDCVALPNGWSWKIPLWSRIGTGYVFSSKFISPEDAKIEFKKHLAEWHSPEIAEKAEPRLIKIRHGKRKRAWVKNVVGIGLSYGFVEPLESTGLLTTHENIINLLEVLNRRDGYVTRMEKESFNLMTEVTLDGFAQFVSAHYAFSKRTDTPYWKYVTQENDYQPSMFDAFQPKINGYGNIAFRLGEASYDATQQGAYFILAGLGVKNVSTEQLIDVQNKFAGIDSSKLEYSRKMFQQHKDAVLEYIQTLPSNYEFMRDRIYGGVDEYK